MALYGRMLTIRRNEDYDRGLRLFDQGLYEAAIPELEKVMASQSQLNPVLVKLASFYLAEAWSFLGSYAIGQRLFERSAYCFEEALKRNNGYADLHNKLASVYYLQDRIDEADRELDAALRINPQYARALVASGLCKYRQGKTDLAFEQVAKAVECDSTLDNDNYKGGTAAHLSGDFESAMDLFSLLVVTDIDDVAYHARLGADFFRRGMLDEASDEFEKALQINPDYADLHNSLGMTYYSAGKFKHAVVEFRRALEINPSYEEARSNYELSVFAAGGLEKPSVNLQLIDDQSADDHGLAS
jgi:tetratricopeptide (TPR) repeat protein